MKTPDEIKKGIECCNSTHYDACPDCPYKGECDAVFSCIRRKSEDTTAYIQQLEANWQQVSKALYNKENATLEEVLQVIDQVTTRTFAIPPCSGKTLAAQRIAELEQELAAVKRERDAAINDLRMGSRCSACKKFFKNNNGIGCSGGVYCIPLEFEWRGVCPENTEVSPDA